MDLTLYTDCMTYKDMSDKDLVDLIVAGNEEAMLYLLYNKYEHNIRFYVWKYYGSLIYVDELINCLYIQLKGKDADWQPLKSFQWKSSFSTWFCRVASHLFFSKRDELIDSDGQKYSIEENRGNMQLQEPTNNKLVILMEAINRLKKEEYRLILLKELEGYNHKEIAEMIVEKRKKENKVTTYKGKIVVPDAHYVDMNKARALKEVKGIVEQIKKEWYGNK